MVDINILKELYFAFDLPVPYQLKDGHTIHINPMNVKDYSMFIYNSALLKIDKNSISDPKVISMSYLDYLIQYVIKDNMNLLHGFGWLVQKCLGVNEAFLEVDDKKRAFIRCNFNDSDMICIIGRKDFEDIRRIILYQNILHYDDSYIDPQLKKSMDEIDELKSEMYEFPNMERKFAMVTAHCGLPKSKQLDMTMRSHQYLFEEICGEVEFLTVRPIALYAGKSKDLEHWVHKNKKDKFDGYITSVEQYNKSMGGDGAIHKTVSNNISNELLDKFNSFK